VFGFPGIKIQSVISLHLYLETKIKCAFAYFVSGHWIAPLLNAWINIFNLSCYHCFRSLPTPINPKIAERHNQSLNIQRAYKFGF